MLTFSELSRAISVRAALPVFLSAAALLAGCSSTMDRINQVGQIDYKSESKQRQLPPLEIPPDLRAPSRDERFELPATASGNTATLSAFNASRAAGGTSTANSDVLPTSTNVRMDRAGSQRWLIVQAPPDKVWPLVKDFWQQSGFNVLIDQPEAGVMETDWAENRAKIPQDGLRSLLGQYLSQVYSTGERDKFRTRLERGAQGGNTEIYVSHRGMIEVASGGTTQTFIWQPRPSDPELEAQFLARLMTHLGIDDTRARAVIAADAQAPLRAKLVQTSGGGNAVEVQEPFDRAWRRVGLALDRVGFTVEDRDRSKGYYFVRYVDPDIDNANKKSDGFLSKLFSSSSSPTAKSEQYRILVKDEKDVSQVQVLNKDGVSESSATARRILALLQDQLK